MVKVVPSALFRLLLMVVSFSFTTGCSSVSSKGARKPGRNIFITPLNYASWGNDQLRLAVKDNIDVAGVVTTAGSKYFADRNKPAASDAACLELARQRGVLIVGKTNLSEFAVSPSGVNEYFGTPRNPLSFWRNRIPGGSSSGSAVAVAKDFADVAFGTDTAGSIRVPAACCGVVGLKTTKGLISLEGVHPIEAEHMDTVGPLAKNIGNTVIGMDLLQRGFLEQYIGAVALQPSGRSIRVGRLRLKGTDPKIDAAIDLALLKAGFVPVPLDAELSAQWEQAKADGNAVAAAGAWISDRKYQGATGVSLRTNVVILAGRLAYNTKYQAALARRGAWQAALERAFAKVDVIALPTLQRVPFYLPSSLDAGWLEAQTLAAMNTVPVNYAGNPALAQPIPLRNSFFPVTSLQLIGPKFGEARLLNAGRIVEETSYPGRWEPAEARLQLPAHSPVNEPRGSATVSGEQLPAGVRPAIPLSALGGSAATRDHR